MPELPEVEVAARSLRAWLVGARIEAVRIPPSRVVPASPSRRRALRRALLGHVVDAVDRRGKRLRITLGDAEVYAHLGMSGDWVRRPRGAPAEKHERLRLDTGTWSVRYVDPRMFGSVQLASAEGPSPWDTLGPDPLADGIALPPLQARLSKTKRSIKEALLDQSLLAGIGNIYAAEALFRARIHPERPASSLSRAELGKLARALVFVLRASIARYQRHESTYVGQRGAENPFRVYGRDGEPCPRCGTTLERLVQGGRSTVLCPRCQPALSS